jgi:hypothetical protein
MHTYTIAVKPFVSKYIFARYGQQVWEINKADRIGKVAWSLLERMPVLYSKSKLDYGSTLTIGICEDYAARKGVYLSNQAIREFNDFIQLEIIEEIAMFSFQVKNRVGLKKYRELYVVHNRTKTSKVHVVQDPDLYQYMEQREIIYDILKMYGITEDDFPYETVRKACQRLKLPLLTA